MLEIALYQGYGLPYRGTFWVETLWRTLDKADEISDIWQDFHISAAAMIVILTFVWVFLRKLPNLVSPQSSQ